MYMQAVMPSWWYWLKRALLILVLPVIAVLFAFIAEAHWKILNNIPRLNWKSTTDMAGLSMNSVQPVAATLTVGDKIAGLYYSTAEFPGTVLIRSISPIGPGRQIVHGVGRRYRLGQAVTLLAPELLPHLKTGPITIISVDDTLVKHLWALIRETAILVSAALCALAATLAWWIAAIRNRRIRRKRLFLISNIGAGLALAWAIQLSVRREITIPDVSLALLGVAAVLLLVSYLPKGIRQHRQTCREALPDASDR